MARFQYPFLTAPVVAGGESITEDKWHQRWTDPVRQKIAPQLAVALIASGAFFVEAAPFPETVTESRWHQPWSEPVRVKPALPAGEQQVLAFHPAPLVPFDWRPGLSEPVRVRPALPVVEQHVFAFEPAPIVSIAWHLPLAEPVRVKPGLLAGAQPYLALGPWPDISIAWWRPLAEPVRVKLALGAGNQQTLAFHPQPFPFVPGSGGWDLFGEASRTALDDASLAIRKRRKSGAPREVAPKIEPPTFADVLGSEQRPQLADVFGSAFAPQLADLRPPALDLWTPPSFAKASEGRPPQLSQAALDAIADEIDARDAMEAVHALEQLEQQERETLIAAVLAHFAKQKLANGE
jgi:hypothetical protein